MIGSRYANRMVAMSVVLLSVTAACGDNPDSAADPERFCEINAELKQQRDPLKLPPPEAREAAREFQNRIDESVRWRRTTVDRTVAYDRSRSAGVDGFQESRDLKECVETAPLIIHCDRTCRGSGRQK